jgi:hypothetical protein
VIGSVSRSTNTSSDAPYLWHQVRESCQMPWHRGREREREREMGGRGEAHTLGAPLLGLAREISN